MNIKQKLNNFKILSITNKLNPHIKKMIVQHKIPDELISDIIQETKFLPDDTSLIIRLYCIKNDVTELPCCKTCNEPLPITKHVLKYCSSRCVATNPDILATRNENREAITAKSRQTQIERYGYYGNLNNPDVLKKTHEKQIERHGNVGFKSSKIRQRAADEVFTKFGMKCAANHTDIKPKSDRTKLTKYGTLYPNSTEEVQQRARENSLEKYGVDHYTKLQIKHALPFITDEEWLIDQHYTQQKTVTEIADELNIDMSTLCLYYKKFSISLVHYNKFSCGYSQLCIKWLNEIMESENIHIQHALNGGEFYIPNSRYRADGYCKETNTIYEFHGDIFHGNPKIFKPEDKCNPFNNTATAQELYDKTIEKENFILSLGYNLVTIWESDYNATQKR